MVVVGDLVGINDLLQKCPRASLLTAEGIFDQWHWMTEDSVYQMLSKGGSGGRGGGGVWLMNNDDWNSCLFSNLMPFALVSSTGSGTPSPK